MTPVTSFFSASNANKNRTPIYRAKFAGVATEYSSSPIKANYADEVLADGPSVFYRFGEASGTVAADSSGHALNGTYHNTPTLGVVGALAGDANTAVQLNGSSQYIIVPYNSILDPGDVFALELWVYPTSFSANPYLLDRGTNGYAIQLNSSGAFILWKSGVSAIVASASFLTLNTWNHIVITKNGSSVHQYLNGKDVTGPVTNATITGLVNPLTIGESWSPSIFFTGSLDELAIYPQALSQARIQAHYDTARLLSWRRNVANLMAIDPSLQSPQMSAAQVIPERGQSSVGTLTFVLQDLADYDSEILADVPSIYLKLDELKSPITSPPTAWAADSSGNSLNGFYQNSPQFGQIGPIQYLGSPDWGTLFNGATQYVSVPHNALEQPGDVFTLEAWVNFASLGVGVDPIFEAGNNGFGLYRSGTFIVVRRTGVQTIAIGTGTLPGGWTHIVVTKNGPDVHIYINGVEGTGSITNSTITATSNALQIGYDGTNSATASFARAAIYPVALSPDRIQVHYNAAFSRPANSVNGSVTRLIANEIQGLACTFSLGFDDITEANYLQLPYGVVNDAVSTQDLTGYRVIVKDPQTLTNKQIFNVASSPLISPMGSGDTTMSVKDVSGFRSSGFVKTDSEIIQYSSKTNNGISISDETWSSITYGNGTFVAVSKSGAVATSTDGKNWVSRSAAEPNTWNGVCWAPGLGLFVAVASSGTHRVMTSPDGAAWTAQTAPLANWNAVAWSPTLNLLAVTGSPGIMTSPDGVGWLSRANNSFSSLTIAWDSTNHLFSTVQASSSDGVNWISRSSMDGVNAIAYRSSGTLWVAVGNGGLCQTSSDDGTSWAIQTPNGAGSGMPIANMRGVADSGSLFVAVGDGGAVATSSNGVTWTSQTAPNQNWRAVVWAGSLSLWVAVANSGTNRIMTSPDGVTWTLRTEPNGGTCIAWNGTILSTLNASSTDGVNWTNRLALNQYDRGIAYSPTLGLWVACGASGVITSTNGVDWTVGTNPFSNLPGCVCWAPSLGIFAMASNGPTDANNLIATSSNGTSWTIRTVPQGIWNSIAWDNAAGLFVAVGQGTNKAVSSTNGTTWVARSVPGGSSSWCSVASDGAGNWVAVRNDAAGTSNQVMTAPDGATWTGVTSAQNNPWQAVAYSPSLGMFVAVASSGTNTVMTSTDSGATWTVRSQAENNQWNGIAWDVTNAIFVACAGNGTHRFMSSTNGTAWTARSHVADAAFTSVGVNKGTGGVFVACPVSGSTGPQKSTNGTTWTANRAAELNTWTGLVWSSGLSLFCAVSKDGTDRVTTSSDGISWTPQTAAEANQWMGVTWAGGSINLLVAISADGTHQLMTSPDGATWTSRTQAASESWSCVLYGDNFVACALLVARSRSMFSSNGTSWTSVLAADKNTWTCIVWASGISLWVALSLDGTSRGTTSPDAINWTERLTSSGEQFSALTYASGLGLLVSVTSGTGNVLVSTDAISWTTRTPAAANAWEGVAFGGGIFAAVGSTGTGNRAMYSPDGFTWTSSTSTLNGLTRGVLGTVAASHSNGATVQELLRLFGHLIDVLIGILQNTDKAGLSIDPSLIDVAGLAIIKANNPSWLVDFRITAAVNAKTFLEQQINQVFGLYPITRSGLYSLHQMATLVTAVDSISPDNICVDSQNQPVIQWDRNFQATIINSITFNYDYDGSKYGAQLYVPDTASIAKYGEYPLVINSQGLRSSNIGTGVFLATIANVFLSRYASGAPLVSVRTFLQKELLEPGDTIGVTYPYLPNRSAKTRGVTNALMEVNSREIDMDQGYVQMHLLWPGW